MNSLSNQKGTYLTRAEAIERGILINLADPQYAPIVAKARIHLPIGITHSAYCAADLEEILCAVESTLRRCCDPKLSDELFLSLFNRDGKREYFKCVLELGDQGERVLTIMLLDEDPDRMKPSFPTRSFGRVYVHLDAYAEGGAMAVELLEQNGDSLTTLSVNLPEENHLLGDKEFFAKTYSENEEIASDALRSGLFQDTGKRGGFIVAPVWKILF